MKSLIVGVDEAGRGCLVGRVYAAAVILDDDKFIADLTDSKQISAKKREMLFEEIITHALDYAIGYVEANEIDQINILQAALKAMKLAVEKLSIQEISEVWVDGNKKPNLSYPTQAIIKGDQKHPCISAASILAKVARDRYVLLELDKVYPQYGFKQHKGYATQLHYEMIKKYGVCKEHRNSFTLFK